MPMFMHVYASSALLVVVGLNHRIHQWNRVILMRDGNKVWIALPMEEDFFTL